MYRHSPRFLRARGEDISTLGSASNMSGGPTVDLSAFDNPKGALLVIDAKQKPLALRFDRVPKFVKWHRQADRKPTTVCISGVGSSALGSAALAWDISNAIGASVVAIVPGYGVADCILQGMGGWFGFGLYNALNTKSNIQDFLANTVPETAKIGRNLSASAPGSKRRQTVRRFFRQGVVRLTCYTLC